MSFILEVITC